MPEQHRHVPTAPAGSVAAQIDELIQADVTTENADEWYADLAALMPPCTDFSMAGASPQFTKWSQASGRALPPLPGSVAERITAGLERLDPTGATFPATTRYRMLTPTEVAAGVRFPAGYPTMKPANHFEATEHLEWGVRWPSPEGNDDKWFGSEAEARTVNESNRGESTLIRRADAVGATEADGDHTCAACASLPNPETHRLVLSGDGWFCPGCTAWHTRADIATGVYVQDPAEVVQDDPRDRCARWYAHDPHDWELHAPGRPLDGTVYRCPGKPEAAPQ